MRPGEKVATDGIVEDGNSAVDMSMLTGESVPVEVGPGTEVAGATVNAGGRLIVRAARVGSDTALAQIARLVTDAQTGKAPVQRLADRVSGIFVPIVLRLAVATLGFWLGTGQSATFAFTAAVAVLIIACPCALGLATPTALMVGTGRGAQLGLLIKGPEVLESTRRIDTIVLDKTGTVTTGKMALAEITVADGVDARRGAAPGRRARARLRAPDRPGDRRRAAREPARCPRSRASPTARASASRASSTATRWSSAAPRCSPTGRCTCRPSSTPRAAPPSARPDRDRRRLGRARDRRLRRRRHRQADVGRRRSPSSRRSGLRPVLLTGDNEATARAVAAEVGIDEVIAEVMPADKADVDPPPAGRRPRRGHGRRRRQRRAGARRRPTSASRSAPAPTSRSRPPT